MVTIKKYGNRRLYDTEASKYITMEELAERIRGGVDVRIVDASTGEDLTQATLTQIIIEGRGAAKLLAVPLLTQLIRMGDDALAEFFGKYMTWALEIYQTTRRATRALGPLDPMRLAASNPLLRMFGASLPAYPPSAEELATIGAVESARRSPTPPPPAPVPVTTTSTTSEVAELRREIEDLKKSMRRRRER